MLDAATLAALMQGDHGDPFSVLGLHPLGADPARAGWVLRVLLPGAAGVRALRRDGGALLAELARIPGSDVFEATLAAGAEREVYVLDVDWGTHRHVMEDAYRFGSLLGETDLWLLAEGTH
ncbi:MAG: hypothetical protein RLZZ524_1244, partial [Pseudomonadota bacterium]